MEDFEREFTKWEEKGKEKKMVGLRLSLPVASWLQQYGRRQSEIVEKLLREKIGLDTEKETFTDFDKTYCKPTIQETRQLTIHLTEEAFDWIQKSSLPKSKSVERAVRDYFGLEPY